MFHRHLLTLAAASALACSTAGGAATLHVSVTDTGGKPAANAVVTLVPESGAAPASHVPVRTVIDQQHETFLPLVVLVRRGGEVVFTNNDVTMHQVYSFSTVKQFQFEIDKAQVSRPVIFDRAGVAAIGCNIHDNMVAYVFVADQPFAAVTDAKGTADIREVPGGTYRASAWHPQLRAGKQPTTATLTVSGDARLNLAMPLTAAPAMSRMHKDY